MESEPVNSDAPIGPWRRIDSAICVGLGMIAGFIRFRFSLVQDLPTFDPWRHLLLIENLEQGRGFSLFADQPYLWYQPIWHRFAAWMPGSLDPSLWAALLSTLAVPVFYGLLRSRAWQLGRRSAALGAMLLCTFAPVTAFTCHLGSEALALLLALLGLLLPTLGHGRSNSVSAALGGLSFGLALLTRLNLAFLIFLVPAGIRGPRRQALWGTGFALPLLLGWWRNARILSSHEWVFTWDGLAIRSGTFDTVSTFFLQRHPDIQQGLSNLHLQIQPQAEWLLKNGDLRIGLLAFMIAGALAVALCGRIWVAAAGVGTLVYLLLLDSTLSANFFRIYLGLFPVYFLAAALLYEAFSRSQRLGRTVRMYVAPIVLVGLAAFAGMDYWHPAKMATPIQATPAAELLAGADRFAVNSGFYQPESLMYRYRDIEFIGLPMHPEDFPAFRSSFPEFVDTIWQPFNVQPELLDYLLKQCEGTEPVLVGTNPMGFRYLRIRCDTTWP